MADRPSAQAQDRPTVIAPPFDGRAGERRMIPCQPSPGSLLNGDQLVAIRDGVADFQRGLGFPQLANPERMMEIRHQYDGEP